VDGLNLAKDAHMQVNLVLCIFSRTFNVKSVYLF